MVLSPPNLTLEACHLLELVHFYWVGLLPPSSRVLTVVKTESQVGLTWNKAYSIANQWVDTTNYKIYILKKYSRRFLKLPPDHNVGLRYQHLLRCQSYFGNSEVLRKANICRFYVARYGSPPLYLSPCVHVIDSGSDMVSLPVKHGGNFQWLYQAERQMPRMKHAATELDIKPLTLGIQSDELYLRYYKLKPIPCYWSHGSRSWKSTHAYLKITLRSFFLAPNNFGLLNRYWNVVKQETQKTAIKVWLVTYGLDSVTSTNLSTIFGLHMDRLWSNSSGDLITAIMLRVSYISRLVFFVLKMCWGKYFLVNKDRLRR